MSKTMKRVSALLLAILMIVTYMPMMQETAYAAKKAKKPAKVKGLKATVKKGTKKIAISWKKAKNAKKYEVTIKDLSTKLTAKKTTKKKKLPVTGQWSTKYKITVKGVNGKKKGKGASKTVKIGADPKLTKAQADAKAALKKAADSEKAAKQLEADLADAVKAMETAKANSATQAEAVEKAQAIIDAYNALTPEQQAALPQALKDAIEDAEEAVKEAELQSATELKLDTWNPEVKNALNAMIEANKNQGKYAVFDFDNTCSIFDVEEQLAIYQLQTMSFDETVTAETLKGILETELDKRYFPATEEGGEGLIVDHDGNATSQNTYRDWIDDICAAFTKLDAVYDFTPAGLTEAQQAEIQATDDWKEFATKMRAMYDTVFATESAAVAYPWVLYWFTGMTEQEVYDLAYRSHDFYRQQNSDEVTWLAPTLESAKVKGCKYKWTYGTQVSDNIKELMKCLQANGIDVWVCSASATDPIRAAIDIWGLHPYVTGLMAMTNVLDGGYYDNEYDWNGGYAWFAKANGGWEKDTVKQKTQTQGKGKVIAIQNVLYPKYNNKGPIAGFMDSTGDFNFCTEFETLQVVCCFNRASRKTTDGGGVIAELAVYQADDLKLDYAKAKAAGDTLYVLQGRDENGLRGLLPQRETHVLGSTDDKLWRDKEDDKDNPHPVLDEKYYKEKNPDGKDVYKGNLYQYDWMKAHNMTTQQVIDTFAIKTKAANAGEYGLKYGFVYGTNNPDGLGPKFHDDTYNLNDLDFAGYHSQH